MTHRTWPGPWHPFLFAICPVLFLYAYNQDQTSVGDIGLGLIGMLLLAAVAVVTGRLLLRKDPIKAAFLATGFILLFASYGHLFALVSTWLMEKAPAKDEKGGIHFALSALYLLLLLGGAVWLRVTRLDLRKPTGLVNLVSGLCLGVGLFNVIGGLLGNRPAKVSSAPERASGHEASTQSKTSHPPDIYYIILDGYARGDTLAEHYKLDNRPFLQALEKRGFYVAPSSFANYSWTFLSLASSLNFRYLDDLPKQAASAKDRRIPYLMIRHSQAAGFLRKQGYRYIHFNSTWGATKSEVNADVIMDGGGRLFQSEFLRALVQTTWLSLIETRISTDLASCHLQQFQRLKTVARVSGPKFVMAHFLMPHHPYLFDRHGKVLKNVTVRDQFQFQDKLWAREDQYIDQLLFVNGKVLEAIDGILAHSARPPVIILQSDHGPKILRLEGEAHVRARLANLAAFHLPGTNAAALMGPNITPVNEFRQVFNCYFDAGLEILTNRHYISDYETPLTFQEIKAETLHSHGADVSVTAPPSAR